MLKEAYKTYYSLDSDEIREELKYTEIGEEYDIAEMSDDELVHYFARNIIENALDIEVTTNLNREYIGSEITLAIGGPNIYLNTRKGEIVKYWEGETEYLRVAPELVAEIDNIVEEYLA